jgi:phage baseplate assembly protein W
MASTREKDLNPDIFIGLKLPLTWEEDGFFTQTKTTLQQAGYNISNLLRTMPGERLGQPLYGSQLHHILFEPMAEDIAERLQTEIRTAMETWLPYILINDINITYPESNPNHINVSIKFALEFDPASIDQVQIDFDTLHGNPPNTTADLKNIER